MTSTSHIRRHRQPLPNTRPCGCPTSPRTPWACHIAAESYPMTDEGVVEKRRWIRVLELSKPSRLPPYPSPCKAAHCPPSPVRQMARDGKAVAGEKQGEQVRAEQHDGWGATHGVYHPSPPSQPRDPLVIPRPNERWQMG